MIEEKYSFQLLCAVYQYNENLNSEKQAEKQEDNNNEMKWEITHVKKYK